jgi:hypothetical protein
VEDMSHKEFIPQWNKFVYQDTKTKHYQTIDTLFKELFGERTKENGLFQQINDLERILTAVRKSIEDINKKSDRIINIALGGTTNIFLAYSSGEALELLSIDQKNLLRDIETIKTQFKLCCERQIELEKKIRGLPIWTQILEKEGQKIQH